MGRERLASWQRKRLLGVTAALKVMRYLEVGYCVVVVFIFDVLLASGKRR